MSKLLWAGAVILFDIYSEDNKINCANERSAGVTFSRSVVSV